jgi:hypothetical protein
MHLYLSTPVRFLLLERPMFQIEMEILRYVG